MDATWSTFLDGSAPAAHGVQVYADTGELAESVAAYLAAGFEAGEPAIVVATPEHREAFAARLPREASTRICSSSPTRT